jgi:hypothetical protein
VLPAVMALSALAWALLQPSEVCTSGSDTGVCTDYSAMRFLVAMASLGLAVLIAAVLGLAIRLRRSAVVFETVLGLALIGVGVASQIRAIT